MSNVQEQADALSLSFEEPLKEAVRNVRSAKATIADRSNALAVLQQVGLPRHLEYFGGLILAG